MKGYYLIFRFFKVLCVILAILSLIIKPTLVFVILSTLSFLISLFFLNKIFSLLIHVGDLSVSDIIVNNLSKILTITSVLAYALTRDLRFSILFIVSLILKAYFRTYEIDFALKSTSEEFDKLAKEVLEDEDLEN